MVSEIHPSYVANKWGTSRAFLDNQSSQTNILGEKIYIHPRHDKEMRPHKIEGFKFLCNKLAPDEPCGYILAHASGSGKPFMLISFMQSFMAIDSHAELFIIVPKKIIESWKREFILRAIKNIPLLDLYSVKAESPKQQMEVLRQWVEQRSILFLGYQQFARIICDHKDIEVAYEDFKWILLEKPTLFILDKGNTSKNKETNMLISLARVKTPRKVVLTQKYIRFMNHLFEELNNICTFSKFNQKFVEKQMI